MVSDDAACDNVVLTQIGLNTNNHRSVQSDAVWWMVDHDFFSGKTKFVPETHEPDDVKGKSWRAVISFAITEMKEQRTGK